MKNLITISFSVLVLLCSLSTSAQTPYKEAWKDKNASIIIDAFYENDLDIDKIKTDPKVVGIIHKATEGIQTVDPKFTERQKMCYKDHLLFGAYHLGTNADPDTQADLFLQTVNDNENTLFVLNLQRQGDDAMTPEGAEAFINHVFESTGKYPVVYVNDHMFQQIISQYDESSVFANCLLWYERLKTELPLSELKNNVWSDYFLWQFSSDLNCKAQGKCLYNVPGTKYDIDVSVFDHDRNALSYVWNTNQYSSDLVFNVTDMDSYFTTPVTCKNGSQITDINYVEVTSKSTGDVLDRYLVYQNNGRTLVSRKMFKYMAEKVGVYVAEGTSLPYPDDYMTTLNVQQEGNAFVVSAQNLSGGDLPSDADMAKKTTFLLGGMEEDNATDAVMYDIKFECD